jgi:cytochrome b6-f complex iron-sulfur subunit
MVIVLRPNATQDEITGLEKEIESLGFGVRRSKGPERDLIFVVGDTRGPALTRVVNESAVAERFIRVLGEEEHRRMLTRRSFINYCLWVGGALTAFLAAIPAISFVIPPSKRIRRSDAEFVGLLEEFEARPYRYVSFQDDRLIVLLTERGELRALSAICTHMNSCVLTWDARVQWLRCPCHRGAFDANGNIIEGPPPRPLRSYQLQVVNDRVYVRSGA